MKLRPASPRDRALIEVAIGDLKNARNAFTQAGCPKVANRIKSALRSADGAKRHIERRLAGI